MGGAGSGRPRKLTPAQEDELVDLYRHTRQSKEELGRRYGVSGVTVMRALDRAWKRECAAPQEGP